MARSTEPMKSGTDTASLIRPAPNQPLRLYQKIAKQMIEDLQAGRYAVGDRMPAERDLARQLGVSRPVVREAMLALEVLGLIEVRIGSGAYVVRLSGRDEEPGFSVSPFELVEARMMFEGEAAALAASHITDSELAELERLIRAIEDENQLANGKEEADGAFHLLIARATRNAAMLRTVEDLWRLRSTSPESALLLEKARRANVRPVVKEHTAILDALKARNSDAARAAMRQHLGAVADHLLFQIEDQAVSDARDQVAQTRERMAQSANI